MKRIEDLKTRLVSIGFMAALVVGGLAQAATVTVGPGVAYDFGVIQAGIDAASSGDTVLVAPGEYVIAEPMTFRGKAITVRSEAGPDETTIRMGTPADPQRASVVVFENSETADSVLDGFTITGGRGIFEDDWGGGGIVFIAASGTVSNCAIVQNTSKWGGGIYCGQPCSPSLVDCTIAENTAELAHGGGIFSDTGSSMSITSCIIRDNSATGSVYGTGCGGGVGCWNDTSLTMTDCTIAGNVAGNVGGGVVGGTGARLTMIHCAIVGNTGQNWCGGVAGWDRASVIIRNCTLAGNSGGNPGGALGCYNGTSAVVTNSILWGNRSNTNHEIHVDPAPAELTVSYSNVAGGPSGVRNEGGTLNWGQGNIDADPCFADSNNGDYHLKSQAGRWDLQSQTWVHDDVTSPCIDRGDPHLDWNAELWPHGQYINMGAYGGTPQASLSLSDAGHISEPVNMAHDVPIDTDLHWKSDELAVKYNLYFGTSFEDVNDAHIADPLGVLVSQAQDANTYDPGNLDFAQTYYWRVDQVNAAPDDTVSRGEVWRFTTEPVGYPIQNVIASASSSQSQDMGPEKTIDGSGLDALDQHGNTLTDMWLSSAGATPTWIQYEFSRVYKLHEMWVWNSNQVIELFLGLGAKDVAIEYSIDGTEWTLLDGVPQFAQATGQADYTHNTSVDFAGVMARFVRMTVNSGYGMMPQHGLSEVLFFYVPTQAREPQPAADVTTDTVDVVLKWRAGREAVSHQVHFSPNRAAVADGTALVETTTTPSLDLSDQGLELGSTYYWRVDEVNESASPSLYIGDLWSFKTPDYLVVDNFDQYDNNCNRIFFAWEDGWGHNGSEGIAQCDVPPSSGSGGGATVGHAQAPFAERTIVNVDSTQSMPLSYNNSLGHSEATLRLIGQDWTASNVQTLSLFFYGQPDNSGQLYVKINNTKLTYDGDATNIAEELWQQWNIHLAALEGLHNVTTLTIGVDGEDAAGMLYIDDIRLCP